LFGSKEDDKEAYQNEKPERVIEPPDFYMDKYPVTYRQYCLFWNKTKPVKEQPDKWIYLKAGFEKDKCRIHLQKRVFTV
jgi:formylglycine-generating enzyme required for sulfatase activity